MVFKTVTFLTLTLLATILATSALAIPRIDVRHQRNVDNFAQIQVQNDTSENLLCHIEIDGHKLRFQLKPMELSKWYTATDVRFNHTHYSVWCDYLHLHPKYQ